MEEFYRQGDLEAAAGLASEPMHVRCDLTTSCVELTRLSLLHPRVPVHVSYLCSCACACVTSLLVCLCMCHISAHVPVHVSHFCSCACACVISLLMCLCMCHISAHVPVHVSHFCSCACACVTSLLVCLCMCHISAHVRLCTFHILQTCNRVLHFQECFQLCQLMHLIDFLTTFCRNRYGRVQKAKGQLAFIKFIVRPLHELLALQVNPHASTHNIAHPVDGCKPCSPPYADTASNYALLLSLLFALKGWSLSAHLPPPPHTHTHTHTPHCAAAHLCRQRPRMHR
jgi:hypothetical protein